MLAVEQFYQAVSCLQYLGRQRAPCGRQRAPCGRQRAPCGRQRAPCGPQRAPCGRQQAPCRQPLIDFSASDQSFLWSLWLSFHRHTLTHSHTHSHTHTSPLQSSWRGRGLEAAVAICPSHRPWASLGFSLLGEFTGLSVYLFGVCVGSYLQHVASSSLTRDRTGFLYIGSMES